MPILFGTADVGPAWPDVAQVFNLRKPQVKNLRFLFMVDAKGEGADRCSILDRGSISERF